MQATGKSQEFMDGCKSTVITLEWLLFSSLFTHLQFQDSSGFIWEPSQGWRTRRSTNASTGVTVLLAPETNDSRFELRFFSLTPGTRMHGNILEKFCLFKPSSVLRFLGCIASLALTNAHLRTVLRVELRPNVQCQSFITGSERKIEYRKARNFRLMIFLSMISRDGTFFTAR